MQKSEPYKILNIDDNEVNLYSIKLTLEKAGYQVIQATTGEEGLAMTKENPDLIILDIQLPNMNGYDVCRQLKADPLTSFIPVLQTSANFISSDHKVEGLESGADGYLAQPIEPSILVATVRSLLRIRNAEKQAQLATQGREEMMAIVSHDLRNPLAAIMLQVKLMAKSYSAKGEVPDMLDKLDKMNNSCKRMNRLIQDLLDVSSIEGGKFNLVMIPFQAHGLLKDVLTSFEELAFQSEVTMNLKLGKDIELNADRERLLQVLVNLISNSLKFTPKGGSLTLQLEETDSEAIFSVKDSGFGIPPHFLPHIFNRYWQGHKERGGGIGLGLSIVRGIIDAHQGRVWVESEVDQGTTVYFAIPKSKI